MTTSDKDPTKQNRAISLREGSKTPGNLFSNNIELIPHTQDNRSIGQTSRMVNKPKGRETVLSKYQGSVKGKKIARKQRQSKSNENTNLKAQLGSYAKGES